MADPLKQPESPVEPRFPAALVAALQASCAARPDVPATVDATILQDARHDFWRRRRVRAAVRWAGATAAAAAAVVVVAVNLHRVRSSAPLATTQRSVIIGDVDRNGRVDIVDAFVLARQLDANAAPPEKSQDVNTDGAVDRRDVDAIAAIAVRLPGGVQ